MASGGDSSPSVASIESLEDMETSSTPERERRSRGKSHGKRGGRGSRSRGRSRGARSSSSRGRGSRSRGRGRGHLEEQREVGAFEIIQQRQESMREELSRLTREELQEIIYEAVGRNPSLMFDIMRPAQHQPGGYHSAPGSTVPQWCVCGRCREMPTEVEKVCCEKDNCVSLTPDFQMLVIDEGVLAIARMYRQDILVFDDELDQKKANRHQAYRQFILWSFGRLSAGDRRAIPSCCVWKIRDKYPDPFSQYTGFVPSRI